MINTRRKYSEGAIKEGDPDRIEKLHKALRTAQGRGQWKEAGELQGMIDKLIRITGTTEFDPGADKTFTRKQRQNVLDLTNQTENVLYSVDTMLKLLEGEGTFTSVVASMTSAIGNTAAQIMQAGRAMAGDRYRGNTNEDLVNAANSPDVIAAIKKQFGDDLAGTALFRSNIVRLAYATGRAADPGSRMTNEDFANAMLTVTGGAGANAKVLAEVLEKSVAAAAIENYKIQYRNSSAALGPDSILPEPSQKITGWARELPAGTGATTPRGAPDPNAPQGNVWEMGPAGIPRPVGTGQ